MSVKSDSSAPPKLPVSGLAKGMALPLEAYMLDYSDSLLIERAQQQLTVSCMARLGFTYRPPQLGMRPPTSANDSNMPRRYGITDRAEAQVWGYHVPVRGGGSLPPSEPISPAEHEALMGTSGVPGPGATAGGGKNGIPRGGCIEESRHKLHADYDDSLVAELNRESMDKTLQDPAVKAVEQQWSSCMKGRGYRAVTPFDADDIAYADGDKPSKAEIAVALADLDCKASTHLVDRMFAVESRIQQGLIEDHQLALNEERQKIADALRASAAAK
jgi:hypothetical protein